MKEIAEALERIPGLSVVLSGHAENGGSVFIETDMGAANLISWAGCHRWWHWGEYSDLRINLSDPDRDSNRLSLIVSLKGILSSERKENADKFLVQLNTFIEEWVYAKVKPNRCSTRTDSLPTGGDCGVTPR